MDTPQSIPYETVAEVALQRSEATWFLAGMILPCYSVHFYLAAARRKANRAILFFLLYGLILGTLSTLGLVRGMISAGTQIGNAFSSKAIPAVMIQDGVALVDGPQPAVLLDQDGIVVIVDTTGTINHLDSSRYQSGLLLTRTDLQIIDRQGRYQSVPLSELNSGLQLNPIVIDGETIMRLWRQFSMIFGIAFWFLAVFWDTAVRLGYLALIALLVWGITRLVQPRAGYSPVFIIGAYAFIPALYLSKLLNLVHVSFFAMQTLIWIVIWLVAIGLAFARSRRSEVEPRGLWTWRIWMGIPMVVVFGLDSIFQWPNEALILWIAAIGTLVALIAIELFQTVKTDAAPSP